MIKKFHTLNNKTNTVAPKDCLLISVLSYLFVDVSILYVTIWGYQTFLSLYDPNKNSFNFFFKRSTN